METRNALFQLEEQDYSPELVEAMDEYATYKQQEGPNLQPVIADQIPPEVKEAMGLDMFPEDIQNDILALGQKIANYVLELVEQSDKEAPDGPQQSTLSKMWKCYTQTPYRDIVRDVNRNVFTPHRTWSPTLNRIRPGVAPTIVAGTTLGALAGHMYGCMTYKFPFRR